jgi:hypothetical protein
MNYKKNRTVKRFKGMVNFFFFTIITAALVICLAIAAQAAFYYPKNENEIKICLTCGGVDFLILIIDFVYL